MSLLVPKNRKPRFRIVMAIQDLSNVPLVSGLVHVRWHLRDSIRSETRGKTERSPINDHKVEWGYEISWVSKLIIDKNGRLQESIVEFEVSQEMYGGKERHALGKLSLNLAEYTDQSETVSRRYLLQESKVNSTLKIGIHLEQLSGDRNFISPELKKAQVFGGIAGILSDTKDIKKQEDALDFGSAETSTRDKTGLDLKQDVYRNSLTRRWQAQAGELDPSDVVDDIFNGSDGWLKNSNAPEKGHRDWVKIDGAQLAAMTPKSSGTVSHHQDDNVGADEADEILRSLAWSINASQVSKEVENDAQRL